MATAPFVADLTGRIAIAAADVKCFAYTVGATGPAHRVAGKLLALPW